MKIGIFGGSFDPIHLGHVSVIEEVKFIMGLDEIIVVPAFLSPHKEMSVLDVESRLTCVNLALEGYSNVTVSDYEINQGKSIYTYDTLNYFKSKYPNDDLILIIGTDQYVNFKKWYRHEDILSQFDVAVVHRNYDLTNINSPFQTVGIPIFDISSSLIRARMESREPYKHLVPQAVYQYLKENL